MRQQITLGSLFDGIGGWQIAALNSNVLPKWSSEIETFPLALTKIRFPNTKQLGDITKIDGGEIEPVDIICAGSPCQNLSMAGNRRGLDGEESGLFIESIRIVRQMRDRTGGMYPKFFVWENVTGAFSSNKGMDFKTVLEKITETEIPMPKSGKWAKSGMVRSGKCDLAWRTLDSQFWGVPQHRERIFLVADFRETRCPEEILFVESDVSKNLTDLQTKKQTNPKRVRESIDCIDRVYVTSKGSYYTRFQENISPSLVATDYKDPQIVFYDISQLNRCGVKEKKDVSKTLCAGMGTGGGNIPIIVEDNDGQRVRMDNVVRKLTPLECERLQGLPDNYTLIDNKSCSDSARYKAIGNGMAQPCPDFIIQQIANNYNKGE